MTRFTARGSILSMMETEATKMARCEFRQYGRRCTDVRGHTGDHTVTYKRNRPGYRPA